MAKLRVGMFDSLACQPLAWGFVKGHHGDLFSPSFHPPATVAKLLAQGNLDIALLPAIDYQHIPGLRILSDLCLASPGASPTCLLVTGGDLDEVRTVAVDPNGRTALALLEIVWHRRFGRRLEFVFQQPDLEQMLDRHDAALLAGDVALGVDRSRLQVFDVGLEWRQLTGLPSVFALWAVRSGILLPDLPFYFKSSLRYGMSLLDNLVRETAAERDLEPDLVEDYLRNHLSFFLREPELQGLDTLFREALELGILQEVRPISFWGED